MNGQNNMSTDSKRPRMYYVDNLRTLLIILVILWHVAVTYGAPGFWPYQESQADELTILVFTVFSVINNPYVLGFFFMIAGYFTPGSYDRRDSWTYFRERFVRLGIPLLIYMFLFDPLIYYAMRVNVWGFDGSFLKIWGPNWGFWLFWRDHISNYSWHGPGVGPLWFVELMLIFTFVYGLGRLVSRPTSSATRGTTGFGASDPPSNLTLAVFALLLGVVIFVMRIWLPINSYYEPLGLPMAYVPQYIALFFLGTIAYRGDWLQKISVATGRLWLITVLVFILVLFPILFVLSGALEGNTDAVTGGLTWQSFAFSIWEEFICVGMIIVLLVWFRERLHRQGNLARAMSDSTFTVYFIHAPVLVFLALSLRGVRLYPLLKWALVSPVALAVCFIIAFLLKKTPILRRIL
jgi:peptidoglycan/LPS O-acetylase OafA/YrhL